GARGRRPRAAPLDRPLLARMARRVAPGPSRVGRRLRSLRRLARASRRAQRQSLLPRRRRGARRLESRVRRQPARRPRRVAPEPSARRRPGAVGARARLLRAVGARRRLLRVPRRAPDPADGAARAPVPARAGGGRACVGRARARTRTYPCGVIRPAGPQDVRFLRDMLRHAYFWRIDESAELPVARYVTGWGREGDSGFVAIDELQPVGAAWYRLFPRREPGFGFVDERTPELTVAVVPSRRGKGIGHELMEALLAQARSEGYDAVSLSAPH